MSAQDKREADWTTLLGIVAIFSGAFVLTVTLCPQEFRIHAIWIFLVQFVLVFIWASPVRDPSISNAVSYVAKSKASIRSYLEDKLLASGMGKLDSKVMESAEYSYQIGARRMFYRKLDCILWLMSIRYVPQEFQESIQNVGCPKLIESTQDIESGDKDQKKPENSAMSTNWKSLFAEITTLIRHDDTLNWQKFNYVLVVFGALLTAYVVNFNQTSGNLVLCMGLGLMGVLLSWGADLTFQEGLRCLRSHRRKQAILEREAPPYNSSFLYNGSAFNQRDVLEAAPLVIFLLSFFLIVVALVRLLAV